MHGAAMMDLHKCRIGVVPDNERENAPLLTPPCPPPHPSPPPRSRLHPAVVALERSAELFQRFASRSPRRRRFPNWVVLFASSPRSVKIGSHGDPAWLTVSMCCRVGSLTGQIILPEYRCLLFLDKIDQISATMLF